ncbi:MAG: hypothetical protein ABI901_14390 [Roseiflexaceae bacterium]
MDDAEALARLRHAARVATPDSNFAALYDRCYREVRQQFAPTLAQARQAVGQLGLGAR